MRFQLLFIACLFSLSGTTQSFTDLQSGFPALNLLTRHAFADVDGDGDQDFAMAGATATSYFGHIYLNDGTGVFSPLAGISFPFLQGSVEWADMDNDGDPDLLVNGMGNSNALVNFQVYRNDGNLQFTLLNAPFRQLSGYSIWMDYDNDGLKDILSTGYDNSYTNDSTFLYHNDGNGNFSIAIHNLPRMNAEDLSVVDFDNDGDDDFFVMGSSSMAPGSQEISRLYKNDGNGNFTQVPFYFFPLIAGTSDWADYDNDGDADLLYDGMDSLRANNHTLIYRNNGGGNFVQVNANLPLSGEPGSVQWGDVDNDGDLDILIGGPSLLMRNDGNDIFTDITPGDFPFACPNTLVDIDQDGDLDIFFTVPWGNGATFFRNEGLNGIDNTTRLQLHVFPNPGNGSIRISNLPQEEGILHYQLCDSRGAVLKSGSLVVTNYPLELNWPDLSNGIYTLQITGSKTKTSTRIVVMK